MFRLTHYIRMKNSLCGKAQLTRGTLGSNLHSSILEVSFSAPVTASVQLPRFLIDRKLFIFLLWNHQISFWWAWQESVHLRNWLSFQPILPSSLPDCNALFLWSTQQAMKVCWRLWQVYLYGHHYQSNSSLLAVGPNVLRTNQQAYPTNGASKAK